MARMDAGRRSAPTSSCRRSLTPLAPVRDQIIVLSGLAHRQAESFGDGNGDHARGGTVVAERRPRRSAPKAPTSSAARRSIRSPRRQLGKDTPLPSLELALETHDAGRQLRQRLQLRLHRTPSRGGRRPRRCRWRRNPRVVFERLFGDGGSAGAAAGAGAQTAQHPRLGAARSRRGCSAASAPAIDRRSPSTSTRCARSSSASRRGEADGASSPLALPDRPTGIPETFDEHTKLMFDLQVLAFQADITRVSRS